MCGIAGWLDWNRDLSSSQTIMAGMIDTLMARGPDARGQWIGDHIALGHSRLAVVDLEGGKQPMLRSRDGWDYVITYNGELYNTEDIRRELQLQGYACQGHSDTEVLLLSYIEWGPECVHKLNGIFAFGIWDERNQHLFLARDRMGVKPLFYYNANNTFIFASEIKALLAHPLIPAEIDEEGLCELFMIAPGRTPGHGVFRNMKEIRPGHCLLIDRNGSKERTYWQLVNRPHTDDLRTTVETVRDLVTDAISRQLVADVPLGTLLSGGLDSSAITAIASLAAKYKNQKLPTFSIDYIDNAKYFRKNDFQPDPDAPWVRKMSAAFSTQHQYFFLDTPELIDSLDAATTARDLPGMADIDSSLLLFSRMIKQQVTVGLSGECADEVFGGYPWFHNESLKNTGTFPWAPSLDIRLKILSEELMGRVSAQDYVQERYQEALREIPESDTRNSLEEDYKRIGYLTLTRFMPTLLDRKDRMTMAAGLEVRVPFCDHCIVEYVWNIPWDLKNFNGREKGLLRLALADILPDDILWRKKSPYPKTHHPEFLRLVTERLLAVLDDPASPVLSVIHKQSLLDMIRNQNPNAGKPWYGQLMDTPRLFAYLLQMNHWFKAYKVKIV